MDDFRFPLVLKRVNQHDARFVAVEGDEQAFRLTAERDAREPLITVNAPHGTWDLSAFTEIAMDVTNQGPARCVLFCHVGDHRWTDGVVVLEPGSTATLTVILKRVEFPAGLGERFPGMNGLPGSFLKIWDAPDPARVPSLRLYPSADSRPVDVRIANLRARQSVAPGEPDPTADAVFPLVDRWGQYRHRAWDGKIGADADLTAAKDREDADLAAHPGPADRTPWGGWAAGPRLAASGHFRTEKVGDRWWLVDPEGALFWSHGLCCVGLAERTLVSGRERMFAEAPSASDPNAEFMTEGRYDVHGANLKRKYGNDWRTIARERAHARLKSWGCNTLANWSDRDLCLMRRTPYTIPISYAGPKLGRNVPNVAKPEFREALKAAIAAATQDTATDPWCLGYFIDNELEWTGSNAGLAESYYRICREELKAAAPDKLYLGSRIHFHYWPGEGPEEVVRSAARHCDVVTFNRYRFTAAELQLPRGFDKPVLIGEFHFGALDRGGLHTGLRSVPSQAQRGAAYDYYLEQCLGNPAIVGAHWFQYHDQCVTGRFDGENYQIGFLDVCDSPYPETIAAARRAGERLYRAGAPKTA